MKQAFLCIIYRVVAYVLQPLFLLSGPTRRIPGGYFMIMLCLSVFFPTSKLYGSCIETRIDSILQGRNMTVGIYAKCGEFCYQRNAREKFPLMSVFKVHVAMAVLERLVHEGVSVDSMVHVDKSSMHENTYSPLRDRNKGCDFDISVADLIRSSVSESDNNACDLLIDMVGGIRKVDRYVRRCLGVGGQKLMRTEYDMHRDVSDCRDNWTTPYAMVRVLEKVFDGAPPVFGLLREAMFGTVTGCDKIRAGISPEIDVAHKTGSSDRVEGIKIGDNDAAVVVLPTGEICYMVVFIKDSAESDAVNASVTAAMAREIMRAVTK